MFNPQTGRSVAFFLFRFKLFSIENILHSQSDESVLPAASGPQPICSESANDRCIPKPTALCPTANAHANWLPPTSIHCHAELPTTASTATPIILQFPSASAHGILATTGDGCQSVPPEHDGATTYGDVALWTRWIPTTTAAAATSTHRQHEPLPPPSLKLRSLVSTHLQSPQLLHRSRVQRVPSKRTTAQRFPLRCSAYRKPERQFRTTCTTC